MMQAKRFVVKLLEEDGQDIVEYALLLAFVCLASAALFVSSGGSIQGIWTTTNTVLSTGNIVGGCS